MSRGRILTLASAALLLEVFPLVAAHGLGSESEVDHVHDAAQPPVLDNNYLPSYWSLSEHAGLMYAHIGLEILAWFIMLPVVVMLSIARSQLALPGQFAFLIINAFALLLGIIFNSKTPALYDNNAHSKTGWMVTWIASAWVLIGLVQFYAGRSETAPSDHGSSQPMTAANMAQYQRVQDVQFPQRSRWSNDSGQGTERNSDSLFGHSRSPSVESEEQQQFIGQGQRYFNEDGEEFDGAAKESTLLRSNTIDGFFRRTVARFAAGRSLKLLRLIYILIDRTILVQGFVAFCSGTVVYGGIGHGGAVFNVLAHYIKGGIFFGYGLLTLGRWMGAFADFGWAWNMKPGKEIVGRRRAALPSAEFTESFVIFLYGCVNVFLEHLAAWGDAWTAQDLEHVSISVMFFGGGLLGMIVESRKMRDLLNSSVLMAQPPSQYTEELWQSPRQYGFSMNPVPALVILLLGKMMSSHHQASMLSTMIHTQWGSMFMGFALARALTYMTLYIRPPTSYLPSRPPTEILTSFCLISGGITFMVSNKDTVAALESYDLDAMFTFTCTMGLTALLMAWTAVLVAIKGWAARRVSSSIFAKSTAGVLA